MNRARVDDVSGPAMCVQKHFRNGVGPFPPASVTSTCSETPLVNKGHHLELKLHSFRHRKQIEDVDFRPSGLLGADGSIRPVHIH